MVCFPFGFRDYSFDGFTSADSTFLGLRDFLFLRERRRVAMLGLKS